MACKDDKDAPKGCMKTVNVGVKCGALLCQSELLSIQGFLAVILQSRGDFAGRCSRESLLD
jgi:hypothetical protein